MILYGLLINLLVKMLNFLLAEEAVIIQKPVLVLFN